MIRTLTGISVILLVGHVQATISLSPYANSFFPSNDQEPASPLKNNEDESRNRFPQIIQDVKVLLSDVIIADLHRDTLEVIFNLSRIYDL